MTLAFAHQGEVGEQDALPTVGTYSTMRSEIAWADSEHGAYQPDEAMFFDSPFTRTGGGWRISAGLMDAGVPYPFRLGDMWFVAVRRGGEEVDFYYVDQ